MRGSATKLVFASILMLPAGAGAKSAFTDACSGVCQDPSVADVDLPTDPRTLATDVNGYTSYWQDCHSGENSPIPQFESCREWCDARDEGARLIANEGLIGRFLDADTYNDLWRAWGLFRRPDDFEQRIVDRYGLQPMPPGISNPYPLPTDDPIDAEMSGGTGQLPMGLIQTRRDGKYDGGIGFTCLLCHGGRIGEESRIGIGNTTFDIEVFSWDLGKAGGTPIPLPYPHNEGRGTINAVSDFEFLMTVRDFDTLDQTPFVKTYPTHASPGDQDPPAWHNTGSRPRVYMDGGVSSDNTRALMQFLTASLNSSSSTDEDTSGSGLWIKKQERNFEAIRAYVDSIEPPPFPRSEDPASERYVDAALADEGERIFHTRVLFDSPVGDGTCSGCHGVYSTKTEYVQKLPDARLVGVAGQIVPKDTIRTDPARVEALHPELRWGWGTLWFAYADNTAKEEDYPDPDERRFHETMNDYVTSSSNGPFYTREQGTCGWVGVNEPEDVRAGLIGYTAPALHGLWATAPYFHNGSVPTVWHVLRYGERPTYWQRLLRSTEYEDRGFDVSLAAYDFERLGWTLDCPSAARPECDSDVPFVPAPLQTLLNVPGSQVWLANQSPRTLTQLQIEQRKIYDTTRYGRSNAGHWWTNSTTLSNGDVEALIAYLKTL